MRWIMIAMLSGCWTVGSLQHSSLKNQKQAETHAQLGEGLNAAEHQQLSVSEEVAARLLYESRGRYWQREVLMR